MDTAERVFGRQVLMFMSQKMLNFDNLTNCGVCLELGSADSVLHILFPLKEGENPQEKLIEIENSICNSYCAGSLSGIAMF